MNCSNIKLFEKQLDEIYHAAVLQLLALYKEELVDYFNIMIPKAIDGKRKSNKVIKLLANMDTFAQSDYVYDSLHILIKKIVVFPEKGLEFTMLYGSIIKITIPRYRLVDHYERKKTSGS